MNDGSTTPETDKLPCNAPPRRMADTLEGLREQVRCYHDMATRRADLIEALGDLFDGLRPALAEVLPGWWEAHDPLALIREEFEGWEPGRILDERQRLGLYLRGPSTPEQRADLQRRMTEAGLREVKSQEQP
ncbi:MAG: hypothetical protein H7Y22_11580 [Gemmatimonadaceae bacterium]|nr:hypothetical protein [Gloeobacterales cyanobacterium ES-bin-141]